jgi:hypothetical protein
MLLWSRNSAAQTVNQKLVFVGSEEENFLHYAKSLKRLVAYDSLVFEHQIRVLLCQYTHVLLLSIRFVASEDDRFFS